MTDLHGHPAQGHADHGGHGVAKYIYVFLALCVLTGASFFTYSTYWPFPDQPGVKWSFMMAVSCTKALLVVLFFMHLKYEADWKYVLTIPASIMSIFLALALVPDIGMRVKGLFGYGYSQERLMHVGTRTQASAIEALSEQLATQEAEQGGSRGGH